MARKAPEKKRHQILGIVWSDRVETLLYEWVNLPERIKHRDEVGRKHPAYDRMIARYPEFLPFTSIGQAYRVLTTVREGLQKIWNTLDPRTRDWEIFNLRNHYVRARIRENADLADFFAGDAEVDFSIALPPLNPFEAAMVYLQNGLSHRMLHCPNPECAAPYFFRSEKGQKACSPECADWLRRQSKLRWYHDSPNSPKHRAGKRNG